MTAMRHSVGADGVWRQVIRLRAALGPALFLDRDGTIVEEVHYLHRPSDVRLETGAGATIRAANAAGIAVVIVTNQAGIGRGYYGWTEFEAVQRRLAEMLAAEQAWIDMVLACPFHEEAAGAYRVPDHPSRKPNPGMVLDAAAAMPIDLGASWIVGDRASDLVAGQKAGLAGGLLVGTGYGARERDKVPALAAPGFEAKAVEHLGAVGSIIDRMTAKKDRRDVR